MSEIVEFLKARLDEDEAMARAADVKQGDPEWFATHHLGGHTVRSKRDSRPTARVQDLAGDDERDLTGILDGRAVSEHIARHDPARALREVEAKRQIIAMHHSAELACPQSEGDYRCCEEYTCQCQIDALDLRDAVEVRDQHAEWPCPTVRALAAAYADHPDYDPEWR